MLEVASRSFHTCARRQSGDVLCWGRNSYGQLGDGRRQDSPRLVKVVGIADAADLAVGRDFGCVRRQTGTVLCWGNNEDGQLGDGRGAKVGALSLRVVSVAGLKGIQQISAGDWHACALERGGVVKCWGNAENGQLGTDAQRAFPTPQPIPQLGPVRQIASGANHVCALETNGTVKCWGRNTEGQLGDGKSGSRIKPVVVKGLEDAVKLASGDNHTCAIRKSGQVVCWGDNSAGQLGPGAGNQPKRNTPVLVTGLNGVVKLAGGGKHTCAQLNTGRAMCWGSNDAGQLGLSQKVDRQPKPMPVRGVSDAVDLGLGSKHSCAVRKTGEVKCWGSTEHGALGPHRLI